MQTGHLPNRKIETKPAVHRVRFENGASIEWLADRDGYLGIGKVSCGPVLLRSPEAMPWSVEIRSPDAVRIVRYPIVGVEQSPKMLRLRLGAVVTQEGPMDWMLHAVRPRLALRDPTQPPWRAADTSLTVTIEPVARTTGGAVFRGISCRYIYRSRSIPIFRILERGTWEPAGRAVGAEFWMRNCFTPSIVKFVRRNQFHSTEWYLPSCENPNIFQFLPLQTELQGFTFTACEEGVLVTWPTRVAHVRSYFEKPRGRDFIAHIHEHCGDLSLRFETAPVEILWTEGRRDRIGLANLYESVKELVHDTLHSHIGMRRERVTTYGQIEEWGNADLEKYRRGGLPRLLKAGCRTIYLANHFQNNMNTWGVSNMCCTVDYKVAESVGEHRLAGFCRDARAAGARVEMWGNTSISTLTEIFSRRNGRPARIRFLPDEDSIVEVIRRAKAPFVRNPSNAIEADHYTPVFAVLNLRDPDIRAYWLKRWKYAHDKIGLEGIFLDSSFNLSSDKFHYCQNTQAGQAGATADQTHLLGQYRPAREPPSAILSQYRAHLDLMVEMQKMGYVYCNEDLGVFGIHRHGPDVVARLDSLPIWADTICCFDGAAIEKAGADPDEVFFKGLAYRMMWSLYWDPPSGKLTFRCGGPRGRSDIPRAWHVRLLHAFNSVCDLMRERRILGGEAGVLYRCDAEEVLWSFSAMRLEWRRQRPILEVLSGKRAFSDTLHTKPMAVYRLGPPAEQ